MNKFCKNHPQKEALSTCNNCGNYYCKDCLNEGVEYYYCNEKLCYEKFKSEIKTTELKPLDIFPSFTIRTTAFFIDSFILFVVNSIVFIPLAYLGMQVNQQDIIFEIDPFMVFRHPLFYWVALFYFSIMESGQRRATFGKRLQGIIVVTRSGKKLSFLRALGRNFCRIFSVVSIIGYFLPLFVKSKQTLHDMICGTLVLNTSALPSDVNNKNVFCKNCNNELELNLEEIIKREFVCPDCNTLNYL